jgi:hypothetical protein
MINAALEIRDVSKDTKASLDLSSKSAVHMTTGPHYVMTAYQLHIVLVCKGQNITNLRSLNCKAYVGSCTPHIQRHGMAQNGYQDFR